MPPKMRKGKNMDGSSSFAPISALYLLHPDYVRDYETDLINHIMAKQHTYDPDEASHLHIPEIVDLMKHQKIDIF